MATLYIPENQEFIHSSLEIKNRLKQLGVFFDQWEVLPQIQGHESQDEILNSLADKLQSFMDSGGYKVADVVSVNSATPGLENIRAKFLAEHTHDEDEIRLFIKGKGYFWFNLPETPVFCLTCEKGDLISVPKNTRHWFDLGKDVDVVAVRIFIDPSGWVPNYTQSSIEKEYSANYP